MKLSSLLFLLLSTHYLLAQGWIQQSGSPNQNERFQLVWADTDSTVLCVGDSAGMLVRKQLDHHGKTLNTLHHSLITQSDHNSIFLKKDFGFLYLSKYQYTLSWQTYLTQSYYEMFTEAGTGFAGGLLAGQNGNGFTLTDALLNPDSSLLEVGIHVNSDETKLYLRHSTCCSQQTVTWEKELHDSTKNIQAQRVFLSPDNRSLVLAEHSRYIGPTIVQEIGFLLVNQSGDLLESNWIPGSGSFYDYTTGNSYYRQIAVEQDSTGFSLLKTDKFYRFDPMGHLLWTQQTGISFSPKVIHRTANGFVTCGYKRSGSENNFAAAALDPSGNLIWSREYDLQDSENWNDILPLPEGGFIAVGDISDPVIYSTDFFAARLNPDGSIFNNLVTGYAFADWDADCVRDAGEPGMGGLNISFNHSYFPYTALTSTDGHFEIPSDTGQYVLKVSNPPGAYWKPCVDSLTGHFSTFQTTDTLYVPFRPTVSCPQMRIDLEANGIRPCSTAVLQLRWQNVGTRSADSVAVVLTIPPLAQLLSADLPFTGLGNGQYRLDIGTVAVGVSGQSAVKIQGDCSLQAGDFLCLEAHVFPDTICATPEPVDSAAFRFVQERCLEVRNSFDPNEKTAEPLGRNALHYIPADTTLSYLVRFQNTGNDTAFTVVVRDTLSPYLDPFSVRPEIASHPYRLEFQEDGSLKFIFENILLPDSTTNEAASHGFIRFQVGMRPGLLPLTAILNRAAIYFDFNPAVWTNTVLRTIEPGIVSASVSPAKNLPVVEISPNPAHSVFELRMELKEAAEVEIRVYDALGRSVYIILPVSHLSAGEYYWNVPIERWDLGMYFLEIQNGDYHILKNIIKQ